MNISTLISEGAVVASAVSALNDDDLTAALDTTATEAQALFALETPTVKDANRATELAALKAAIEAEQGVRAAEAAKAAEDFAAAKAAFSADAPSDEDEAPADEDEVEAAAETEAGDEAPEAEAGTEAPEAEAGAEAPAAVAASANRPLPKTKASVAKRVGAKAARPAAPVASPVTITAGADIQGIPTGSVLNNMDEVAQALISRVKGFPKHNEGAAKSVAARSGGESVLHKHGLATFQIAFDDALVASGGSKDFAAILAAKNQDRFSADVLTAGGWCAPSENVYSFVAGNVIDGLVTVPEVSAPRGGLNITTGPTHELIEAGINLDNQGWTQTEAQAIAKTAKTFEVIECPDFTEYRLDAVGYGYTIPFLTQKAYPEIVTEALKFAGVLWAHKMNKRTLADMVSMSSAATYGGYGATFTDALEALAILATKERRKWHVGQSTVMEVKLPEWTLEVFRADISRRTGIASTNPVTDQMIAAEFSARNLAVEYVADWQPLAGVDATLPASFQAMIFPAGTFVKAVEDVVNLSAVYDAASLKVNEYTGVFFEQGYLTAKTGYGSRLVTIPISTAGLTGSASLDTRATPA